MTSLVTAPAVYDLWCCREVAIVRSIAQATGRCSLDLRMLRRSTRRAATVVALLLWMTGQAATATAAVFSANGNVFRLHGSLGTEPLGNYDNTDPEQAVGSFSYDDTTYPMLGIHGLADSGADITGLRARAFGQVLKTAPDAAGNADVGIGAGTAAFAIFDDMLITGPAGPVTTSLNLFLEGDQSASTTLPQFGTASAHENVQISFRINGSTIAGGLQSLSTQNGDDPTFAATEMLTTWGPIAGAIATPTFSVQANVPFSLQLLLNTFVEVNGSWQDSYSVEADADFGSTLTFAINGPVFSLPAGYTANSPGAGIVSNQYVPEPSMSSMVTVSAGLLLAFRLRNGARRQAL